MIEGLATNLVYDVLKGAGKAFDEYFHGDKEQQAMKAVMEHAFQAMLDETMADLELEERSALYIKIRAFVERPNVSHLLLDIALNGKQPKKKALKAEFEEQNLDPDEMMVFIDSFSAAFVEELVLAAEPADSPLFNIVAVNELKNLSATLKDVKRDVKEMKRLVQQLLKRLDMSHRAGAQAAVRWNDSSEVLEAPKKLIGREAVLARVMAHLDAGENVLLQAFSGTGKTALAGTLAQVWLKAGKGTVLWLRAGSGEPDALFEALAHPFGLSKEVASSGEAKAQTVHAILRGNEVKLLVLDDCWNGEALSAVLKAANGIPTLMTARREYKIEAKFERLDDLDAEAALKLLKYHWKGDEEAALESSKEEQAARDLCKVLSNLAFAVRIAGLTLNLGNLSAAELLEKTVDPSRDVTLTMGVEKGRENVAALLDASLETMNDVEARTVFLAFGAFFVPSATPELMTRFFLPAPRFSDEVVAQVRQENPQTADLSDAEIQQILIQEGWQYLDLDTKEVEGALNQLQEHGLAERVMATDEGVAYYRIHDLAYAYAKAQNDDGLRDIAVGACLAYTWRYNKPSLENFKRLRPELDNFMGAAEWAFQRKQFENTERFAWNLYVSSRFLFYQGFYTQAVKLLEQAAKAAEARGNKRDQGAHLGNLGSAYARMGQEQQAIGCYQQALAIAKDIGDRSDEGNHLGNLGNTYRNLGQYQTAIDYYQQTLAISRDIGDKQGEGSTLGNLGNAYFSLGQYDTAIDYHQQALAIAKDIGDKRGEGNHLGSLGNAYRNLGQYDTAIDYHQQALAISRDIGDKRGEGNHLGNLGNAYFSLGQYDTAIDYHQQALAIAREIGDRSGEGTHLGNLGNVYVSLGQYQKAIGYYQQALAIARDIGDRRGEGNHLGNLGNAYHSLGQYQQAIDYHQRALTIARDIGDRRGEGNHLNNLGSTYLSLGQYDKAIDYYQQARAIFAELGLAHTVEDTAHNIAIATAARDGGGGKVLEPANKAESGPKMLPPELIENYVNNIIAAMREDSKREGCRSDVQQMRDGALRMGKGWENELAFAEALLLVLDDKPASLPEDNPYRAAFKRVLDAIGK